MLDLTRVIADITKAERSRDFLLRIWSKAALLSAVCLLLGLSATICLAQQPEEEGVCARVRIRISQNPVLTRTVFRATLEVSNSDQNVQLQQFRVALDIRDKDGQPAYGLFQVRPPVLTNISNVDGAGTIDPGVTASVEWTIVPTRDAAANGATDYTIGGRMEYLQEQENFDVPLYPAPITVKPDPFLTLDYFLVRDVYSDDPFTPAVEPAEPFPLGLLVKNLGKGQATNFHITSSQPEIIENEKGLLIDFKIIGTRVNSDEASPSLTVNLGDIGPDQTATARWMMTTSLQGKFIEYKATFEHVDGLGDPRVSLIDQVAIHELIHAVRVDIPSDDGKPDFLANDIPDEQANPDHLPNVLYDSLGTTAPVTSVTRAAADGTPSPGDLEVHLTCQMPAGWAYLRTTDPGGDSYVLQRVVRSDGREILVDDNAWTTHRTIRLEGQAPYRQHLLHLIDEDSTGSYTLFYGVSSSKQRTPMEAKRLDNDMETDLAGVNGTGLVVTAIFSGSDPCVYVEAPDRNTGIKLANVTGVALHQRIRSHGRMKTSPDGERYMDCDQVQDSGETPLELGALEMSTRSMGGGSFAFNPTTGAGQAGVVGGVGVNSISLLVKLCGKVTEVVGDSFWLDDGAGITTDTGHRGVRLTCPDFQLPSGVGVGAYVSAAGISSCAKTSQDAVVRRLRPRDAEDVQVLVNAPPSGIEGKIALGDYSGAAAGLSITVQLRQNGQIVHTEDVIFGADGSYRLAVEPGLYDVSYKASHWLRTVLSGVQVPQNSFVTESAALVNGDCDGDNFVGEADYDILSSSWYKSHGEAGFDARADLDGDGFVGEADYDILGRHWYQSGDSWSTSLGQGVWDLPAAFFCSAPVRQDTAALSYAYPALHRLLGKCWVDEPWPSSG